MGKHLKQVKVDIEALVDQWQASGILRPGDLFLIGCSTSEVAGKEIGTSGSEEIAAVIYQSLKRLSDLTGVHLVFQCCEHLNRALVLEKTVQESFGYEAVSVRPVPTAGGSMASYAYGELTEPVVVEAVQANAGIDIGETLIGMHLKHVAVPVRFEQKTLGNARVIIARTRAKLIGGERAQYE